MAKRVPISPTEEKTSNSPEATLDLDFAFYERQLEIDKHQLDEMLLRQPGLYNKVSERYAMILSQRDGAKDEVKDAEASAGLRIRRIAEQANKRLTEDGVKARVQVSEERSAAHKRYIELIFECERWEGLKKAFEQRSYVLKDLGGLWIAGYFGNSAARGSSYQVDKAEADSSRREMAAKRKDYSERRT